MKMAEDDEALKLASKEDKDNTVLRKKFRLKKMKCVVAPQIMDRQQNIAK